jgi:hypothetical protein
MTDLLWTHLRWADLLLTHIRTTVFSDDSDLLLTSIWSAVFPYDSWVTPDSHLVSCFPIWLSYSWLTFGHLFSHMTELLLTHIKSAVSHMTRSYSWLTSGQLFPIWLSYSWLTSGHLFSHMTELLLTHIWSAVFPYDSDLSYSWLISGHHFYQETLVSCLMSLDQYFSYFHEENNFTNNQIMTFYKD